MVFLEISHEDITFEFKENEIMLSVITITNVSK